MSDVTRILDQMARGDLQAADELAPLVYDELRALAERKLASEKPGQTLQATALVHEAYVRLVGTDADKRWENRGHFIAAAAEAMRRILVDVARRKLTIRHGGRTNRLPEFPDVAAPDTTPEQTVAIDELLDRFADEHARQAEVAKMRLFLDMTLVEISQVMGYSADTAEADWAYGQSLVETRVAK